jgi:hypothetical protein
MRWGVLKAVFAVTLNGKNNFGPSRRPASAYLSRILRGLEQKLKRGAPIGIQAMGKRYSYLRRSWGRFFILWLADFTL